MDEGYYKNKKNESLDKDIVFSKAIKAGKRVYYLDVKKNRKDELFLIITESKIIGKNFRNQNAQFEKHKIFLYKEDFDKFLDGLEETIAFIRENNTVDFVPKRDNYDENNSEISENIEIIEENLEIINNNYDA